MKNYLTILTFLYLSTLFCQVGINTNSPDPSSILDLNATNKGLLIPKYILKDLDNTTQPVLNPAKGLMIYNESDQYHPKGIYFWNNTQWEKFHVSGDFSEVYAIAKDGGTALVSNSTTSNTSVSGYTKTLSNTISGNVVPSYTNSGDIILPKGVYSVYVKIDGTITNYSNLTSYYTAGNLRINNFALNGVFTDGSNNLITDLQTSSNLSNGAILGYEFNYWMKLDNESNTVRFKLYYNSSSSTTNLASNNVLNTNQSGLKIVFKRLY